MLIRNSDQPLSSMLIMLWRHSTQFPLHLSSHILPALQPVDSDDEFIVDNLHKSPSATLRRVINSIQRDLCRCFTDSISQLYTEFMEMLDTEVGCVVNATNTVVKYLMGKHHSEEDEDDMH
ncbi:hypothetical protein CVT24_002056 [Panaeolus cyanescens]|uniref:Uncharacterized protein n=1 Tax=Panaeolus cyanescens TaxID=181874 RepID=A0A409WJA3_9AGAR|nr:hypothetical protein CVT24_002056 [Panaeolus cyanescens]